MSEPGWYPDPANRDQLRFWDGRAWTTQVAPATPAPPSRRTSAWAPVLIAVLVVALVVVGWWWRSSPDATAPVDSSSPTVSAWDETSAPSPTASPTALTTEGVDRVACDREQPATLQPESTATSLTVGDLTMPAPGAPWEGPRREPRLSFSSDVYGYVLPIPEEVNFNWASSMQMGLLQGRDGIDSEQVAQQLLQCIVTSAFYTSVDVTVASATVSHSDVDGAPAVWLEATLSFDHPRLTTKGSKLWIGIIDLPRRAVFFAATPVERDDHSAAVTSVIAGLSRH